MGIARRLGVGRRAEPETTSHVASGFGTTSHVKSRDGGVMKGGVREEKRKGEEKKRRRK